MKAGWQVGGRAGREGGRQPYRESAGIFVQVDLLILHPVRREARRTPVLLIEICVCSTHSTVVIGCNAVAL
jgi:hypothetical protein